MTSTSDHDMGAAHLAHLAHLARLGVVAGASERDIRRAYARELKLLDLEQDAAAFQHLRDAYDMALAQARRSATGILEQAHDTASADSQASHTDPASAVPPTQVSVDTPTPKQRPAPARTVAPVQVAGKYPFWPLAPASRFALAPSLRGWQQPYTTWRATANTTAPDAYTQRPARRTGSGATGQARAPEQMAQAVFAALRQQLAELAAQGSCNSSEAWRRALGLCLADPRLDHLAARKHFEQHVAQLLAAGWQPGHEKLFDVSIKAFDWGQDRRRLHALGHAGSVIDAALTQSAILATQPSEEQAMQCELLERLRSDIQPTDRELVRHMVALATMAARFPHLLHVVSSNDHLTMWRRLDIALPAWRRKLVRLPAPARKLTLEQALRGDSHDIPGWLVGIAVLVVIKLLVALVSA